MKDALYQFQNTVLYLDGMVIEKHDGGAILCLAHLVSKRALPKNASVEDAKLYFEKLAGGPYGGCDGCQHRNSCPLCMVNE